MAVPRILKLFQENILSELIGLQVFGEQKEREKDKHSGAQNQFKGSGKQHRRRASPLTSICSLLCPLKVLSKESFRDILLAILFHSFYFPEKINVLQSRETRGWDCGNRLSVINVQKMPTSRSVIQEAKSIPHARAKSSKP